MEPSWVADAEINFQRTTRQSSTFFLFLCEPDKPVFFHLLGQSRCQDMSTENADLDETGSIFCQLNQWIVSGPPWKRRSGGKKKKHSKRMLLQDRDWEKKERKKINSWVLLSANRRGAGVWLCCMWAWSTLVVLTSLEDHQQSSVRCTSNQSFIRLLCVVCQYNFHIWPHFFSKYKSSVLLSTVKPNRI